jgi:DNA-binding protein
MDKYKKVIKPKETVVKDETEIRVTAVGSVSAYCARANTLFTEQDKKTITITGTGNAITKAVTLAEVVKRRFVGLHQITSVGTTEIVDEYEPLEEGLDKVMETRNLSTIEIKLSKDALDTSDKGYQAPLPESEVTAYDPEKAAAGRGRGRGKGKGRGKSSKGKGKGKSKAKDKGKGKGKGKSSSPAKGKGKSKDKGKSKGKGKDSSPKGKGKSKDKGKGKGKGKDASPPKGKSKGKGKYDTGKGKGKSSKGWYDDYDYYPPTRSSGGKKGGKSKSYDWWDDYGYGKSKGKGKSSDKGKGKSKGWNDWY